MAKKQPRSLTGKVVTITGAARGIGRATAAALIAQGAVVAIGDIDQAAVTRTAQELGGGTIGLPVDVTKRESFAAFLDEAQRRLGPIDVFINNAGILPLGPFVEERDEITARVLEVNVMGVMIGSKLALERLLPRATGHLVNIASAAGKIGLPGGATYCTSKHAVVGLTESLRAELKGSGIGLHLVMPAPAATDMAAGQRRMRGVKLLDADDVANAVLSAIQSGRYEVFVPRSLGPLLRSGPAVPRRLGDAIARLMGLYRVFGKADPLARAAYEARIAAPAASNADPAATVASAAASVADAVGDH